MSADLFALDTDQASVLLERETLPDGRSRAVWRHVGARVEAQALPPLADWRGMATYSPDRDVPPQVVPPAGLGWFGPPAMELRGADGQALPFIADGAAIECGEDRLTVRSADSASGLVHRLVVERLEGGAMRWSIRLENASDIAVTVDALASALLPLPMDAGTVLSWRGRHNGELRECLEPLPQHRWERRTQTGISGHGGAPGCYVLAPQTGWEDGLAIAMQLEWSGDSALFVERDDEGRLFLGAQALLQAGEIVLQPGEAFDAPPVLLAISTAGRNGAMAQQHAAVRGLLRWPDGAMAPRPVHANSWEAVYFDHDAARIARLARAAADIGAERFVLDDGWFAGRHHDRAGLGDWTPDPGKYPDGLAPLAREIEAAGLQFGLWVEPEMVNPDSDLYRAHPDWALHLPGRAMESERPTARGQLVLDLRREDVREHLFEALDTLLRSAPIRYLKWDHNRHHAPGGGMAQVRGAYALLERLRAAHPALEIEGCAGGGGRSDAGLARFAHRFWTSDTTDAVARIAMQRGFLAFLPPEIMGAHVGASPAHTTGRRQSLAFRAAIACMGHMGVELDPEALDESERAELADWVAFYRQWRGVLHGGQVRLGEAADGIVWQAHRAPAGNTPDAPEREEWLLFVIRRDPAADRLPRPLELPFASKGTWQVELLRIAEAQVGWIGGHSRLVARMMAGPVALKGEALAGIGLPLPVQRAESVAIYRLCRDSA